jgi:hypothetical protein
MDYKYLPQKSIGQKRNRWRFYGLKGDRFYGLGKKTLIGEKALRKKALIEKSPGREASVGRKTLALVGGSPWGSSLKKPLGAP